MVGREEEVHILRQMLLSNEAEMVSVLGRRRVGKTYLLRETFKDHIVFEFTGIEHGTLRENLHAFAFALQHTFGKKAVPGRIKTWLQAFEILIEQLELQQADKKRVVFIDELPWIAGKKPDFIKALGFFWNSWASKQSIVVAICGSAAAWMIKNVLKNKGALHNRITRQIYLQPFTCKEAKAFLQQRGHKFTDEQITELYMTFGGIPHYLKLIEKAKSVGQVVNSLCFDEKGALRNEFDNLYAALFTNHEPYIAIIKACFTKWKGVTQSEIVKLSGIPSGGTLTRMLYELELSGFIISTPPFANTKKETLYRLLDEFSVFHLKFMEGKKSTDWNLMSQSQPFKLWKGYAFENFCFRHIPTIKARLGIGAVVTQQAAYHIKNKALEANHQIDLIIDRKDECINICEIKYHQKPYTITKSYATQLRQRLQHFSWETNTKKMVLLTFISKYGITMQSDIPHLVDSELVLADFYA